MPENRDYQAVARAQGVASLLFEVSAENAKEARSRAMAKAMPEFPAHVRKDVEIVEIKEVFYVW